MGDPILDRITYQPEHGKLAPIPWPEGLAPKGTQYGQRSDGPLPLAEVVVVTWTFAEGEALADVLTPGLPSASWQPYAHLWSIYRPQLTERSPAGDAQASAFGDLAGPNAAHLAPIADRPPRLTFGGASGGVETIDYFGFANTNDSYGVVSNYPDACTEEMDDATLPLALADISNPPRWCSIRNASDPQVSSSIGDLQAQARWATQIYQEYGYWTTVGSAIATWAVIANLT